MGFDLYYSAKQTTKGLISDSTSCVGGGGHKEIPRDYVKEPGWKLTLIAESFENFSKEHGTIGCLPE